MPAASLVAGDYFVFSDGFSILEGNAFVTVTVTP
jgi:hypothetical protein